MLLASQSAMLRAPVPCQTLALSAAVSTVACSAFMRSMWRCNPSAPRASACGVAAPRSTRATAAVACSQRWRALLM